MEKTFSGQIFVFLCLWRQHPFLHKTKGPTRNPISPTPPPLLWRASMSPPPRRAIFRLPKLNMHHSPYTRGRGVRHINAHPVHTACEPHKVLPQRGENPGAHPPRESMRDDESHRGISKPSSCPMTRRLGLGPQLKATFRNLPPQRDPPLLVVGGAHRLLATPRGGGVECCLGKRNAVILGDRGWTKP